MSTFTDLVAVRGLCVPGTVFTGDADLCDVCQFCSSDSCAQRIANCASTVVEGDRRHTLCSLRHLGEIVRYVLLSFESRDHNLTPWCWLCWCVNSRLPRLAVQIGWFAKCRGFTEHSSAAINLHCDICKDIKHNLFIKGPAFDHFT